MKVSQLQSYDTPLVAERTVTSVEDICSLIVKGELERARAEARLLDTYSPSSDEEWGQWHEALIKLQLSAPDEIMTVNYLRRFPTASEIRLQFASRLLLATRKEEARAELDIALRHAIASYSFWVRATQLLLSLGEWSAAERAATVGLRLRPNDFWLQMYYVEALLRRRRHRSAKREAARMLGEIGGSMLRCIELMKFCERWDIPSLCMATFGRAVDLAAMSGKPVDWLTLIEYLSETPDGAMIARICDVAAVCKIDDSAALQVFFDFAERQGRYDAAIKLGEQIQEKAPNSVDILRRLAALKKMSRNPCDNSRKTTFLGYLRG